MTKHRQGRTAFIPLLTLALAVGILWPHLLEAQRNVGFLGAVDRSVADRRNSVSDTPVETFTLRRNLIFFEASVDGKSGNYILDTGAPSLIVNHRGNSTHSGYTGVGAGGSVALTDHRVEQFVMGDRTVKNYWAIGLDLRGFEDRTSQRIDGFVGYDLINSGELRIDYRQQKFQLLKSRHRPTHGGAAPRWTIKFFLVDHLPVIKVDIGGKPHYFALDTGAGSNLLDPASVADSALVGTGKLINIQGLDGRPSDRPIVRMVDADLLGAQEFVSLSLGHLQSSDSVALSGILGSPFLSQYTIGIDYRRRRVYLW